MSIGTLYGISVGTGDPELITVKGLRLLQQAKAIAFPAGVGGKLGMAQQIVSSWLRQEQTQLSLNFPYVQESEVLIPAWEQAAEKVWQYLQVGEDVAFACEGDVSFYSTFSYLAQTLQQLHPEAVIQAIPGVCSPMAATAALGVPLTVRAQKLAILPALYTMGELETVLDWADVVVLMKISSVYEQVWQILQKRSLLDRSWVVERATLSDQKIYTGLRSRSSLKLPYFSILIVQVCPATYPESG
ncbi:precorrin-2 C(20)-methyltransferase [Oscillatoria salina]|uniref:precorrin-2 C(20)-methyltransferase n=1 Tax=Oscillatoria salina TaxID=331517 RepID=UPI0013BC10D2|nr:precorrin-2 C(20)-methyltransferase [Oscillatoria salina]MBZ8182399.1 precorrin-2 C(20)-methyltransferase [Oscillatoria salina IIICB1]NET91095.1 precorrin-2 C(20)-methyltransferase [Kamptonema sp. SIO1D9]